MADTIYPGLVFRFTKNGAETHSNTGEMEIKDMAEIILFDIDDTIYAKEKGLQTELARRAKAFIAKSLGIGKEEANTLFYEMYHEHGTVMSGLKEVYSIEPDVFIGDVFDLRVCDFLSRDEELIEILTGLKQRKYAFSNSPREHVERVLTCLGIVELFDGIYDRRFFNFGSKSDPAAYEMVLNDLGVSAGECILVDDKAENIMLAKGLGMGTVWVNKDKKAGMREADFTIGEIKEIRDIPLFNNFQE